MAGENNEINFNFKMNWCTSIILYIISTCYVDIVITLTGMIGLVMAGCV